MEEKNERERHRQYHEYLQTRVENVEYGMNNTELRDSLKCKSIKWESLNKLYRIIPTNNSKLRLPLFRIVPYIIV